MMILISEGCEQAKMHSQYRNLLTFEAYLYGSFGGPTHTFQI